MKKQFMLLTLMLSVAANAFAEEVEIGGIWYEVVSTLKEAKVIQYKNDVRYSGSVVIPPTVEYKEVNYSVTSIGKEAFLVCTGLEFVTIPNSVTSIGECAFCGCSNLTFLTIPNSVTSIGDGAFWCCGGLTSVIIPNSVTSIGNGAFNKCSSLTSVTIPNSVTSIGQGAFIYCTGLTSITLGSGVKTIYSQAFANCPGLTDVNCFAENVPRMLDIHNRPCTDAFDGSNIDNVTLHVPAASIDAYKSTAPWSGFKSVVEMKGGIPTGNIAFADVNVKALCVTNWDTDGDGELSYGEAAAVTDLGQVFQGRKDIFSYNELEYFTGLTIIGNSTFSESSLMSVTIPNSVTSIGDGAFGRCKGLTSVTIPNSVTNIGRSAFYDCISLTSITIPNSVTSIREDAFLGCSSLASIVVEAGNIVYDSRNNCNAIIMVTNELIIGCQNTVIPNSVTSIGRSAFSYCSGLTSITIPNSVTSIEGSAFHDCSGLNSVTIPNSVTSIGNYAFKGCSGLTSIVVEAGNTVYDSRNDCNAIINTETNELIAGCKNTIIPNSVTSIGKDAFSGCIGLTSVTIPNSVTSIGDDAFYGCSGLTSVIIPNSVTSIGKWAFRGCSGLTSVIIPNSVTSIEYGTFYGCSGLTSVTIPNSVTSIGGIAFQYCSGLTEIRSYIEKPFGLGGYCWFNVNKNIPLYVPAGTKTKYQATDGWNEFTNIVEMESLEPVDGDVNSDGKVDIVDVTMTISHILGQNPAGFNMAAADVNGDKKIDIVDVTSIIDIILK